MTARADILAVADVDDGRASPRAGEAVACAREIAAVRGGEVAIIVVAGDPDAAARVLAGHGPPVIAATVPGIAPGDGEAMAAALAEIARDVGARTVCFAHAARASEVAPRLAVRLGAACIASVEGVEADGGALVLRRRLHGGKIVARVRPLAERFVVTTAPGAFRPLGPATTPGRVVERDLARAPSRTRVLASRIVEPADPGLTDAEVIVAAGRGIGPRENLALAERLAALFPKSAVGGSRPVCDAGWLPYRRQVGLTGATVAPRLYVACGIAGAAQHVAGMRGAGFVVAINRDPDAAIFQVADIGVVADVTTFLPLLVRAIETE